MLQLFQAGPHLVTCDLTALDVSGPYRLTVRHAHGVIVEYFQTTTAALMRRAALEDLLAAAQGFDRTEWSVRA